MRRNLWLVALLVLLCGGGWADLCPKCVGMMYTMDVGVCKACGGGTSSGAHQLCRACSKKLNQCEHCRAALAEAKAKEESPAAPGTVDTNKCSMYESGKWMYVYAINKKGSKSESRSGVLTYDRKPIADAAPGDRIKTPWGVMQYFGVPNARDYNRGWLLKQTYDQPIDEKKGRLLPEPAGAATSGAEGPAWTKLFEDEAWYKRHTGKEEVFSGTLVALSDASDAPARRTRYYALGDRMIWTAGLRSRPLDDLVGKKVEIRGKGAGVLEGLKAFDEIWPAAVREATDADAAPPAGAAWTRLFSDEQWYRDQPGKEKTFPGTLEAVQDANAPSILMRLSYYRLAGRTIYTAARRVPALDALVGKKVEIRGKLVDLGIEGETLPEIWPAAVREAAPADATKPTGEAKLEQTPDGNFVLYVSNQSSALTPVDVKVTIDGLAAVDGSFAQAGGHNWKKFVFALDKGPHELKVASVKGGAVLTQKFEVKDKHWAVIDYWFNPRGEGGKKQFTFRIQDTPIYFM